MNFKTSLILSQNSRGKCNRFYFGFSLESWALISLFEKCTSICRRGMASVSWDLICWYSLFSFRNYSDIAVITCKRRLHRPSQKHLDAPLSHETDIFHDSKKAEAHVWILFINETFFHNVYLVAVTCLMMRVCFRKSISVPLTPWNFLPKCQPKRESRLQVIQTTGKIQPPGFFLLI